jgi:calcium/calmodulin-dependent protein kinase I
MHRKRIIHRDLKPDNILLMDRAKLKVCISDLGLTCRIDDELEINQKCGTPGYVGPEVLKGAPFTPKSDIFSIGCFFFNMITCSNLFSGRNGKEILISNKYQNPFSVVQSKVNHVSPECKNLLLQMLKVNPDSRPTAEQCIQHDWFSKDREAL